MRGEFKPSGFGLGSNRNNNFLIRPINETNFKSVILNEIKNNTI